MLALTAALVLAAAACGGSQPANRGMGSGSMDHGGQGMSPGMQMGPATGTGLTSAEQGFTLDSSIASLAPGQEYRFRIVGPDGKAQTSFVPDQTKLMHLYAIRSDLTDHQHLHPEMAADGTWSVRLPLGVAGPHRVYASFIAGDAAGQRHTLVLSRELMVPGTYQPAALPPAASSAEVDGYTVTLLDRVTSGTGQFRARVTKGGQPVADLQPYLDTYAHVTAFRSSDQAFAHLHPEETATAGKPGGPDLTFHTELPGPGDCRLYIQFQTAGRLHTAAITVHAA